MTRERARKTVFGVLPWPERQAIAEALRTETVGGLVLLAAAVLALVWANSPWSGAYESIRDFHFGIPALGLDLSVGHWTADGLLAVFFLVAGIELKRELVVGELRTPATVAGVAMGLILRTTRDEGEPTSPGGRVAHLVHPFSAGIAVPLFALFAAGVSVSGEALGHVFTDPEPLAVLIGLVVGKVLGIFLGTYLAARFTRAELNPDLAWADVLGLATLAGIGFTVALLIGELAFPDPAEAEHVKAAVLVGSLLAAALAAVLLRRRNLVYKRLWEEEERDEDADGIPDIYQTVAGRADRLDG
ncbi:Na+/H+ antiporter NhaA [Streptomyces gulbargensis]